MSRTWGHIHVSSPSLLPARAELLLPASVIYLGEPRPDGESIRFFAAPFYFGSRNISRTIHFVPEGGAAPRQATLQEDASFEHGKEKVLVYLSNLP